MFAANEMYKMMTMTTRSQERQGWRLLKELRTENAWTAMT